MKIKGLLLSAILLSVTTGIFAQALTFKVKTVPYNGTYAPEHVLAIWITNANNIFVKTIDRHAGVRINYLTNWVTSSAKNVVDATTGATLTGHPAAAVTYNWNCTDVNKKIVIDGDYYINVEFTESSTTGKYVKYPFKVGPASSSTLTSPTTDPGKYFQDVSYSITVSQQTLPVEEVNANMNYGVVYQPASKSLLVNYDVILHKKVVIAVFDAKGKNIRQQDLPEGTSLVNLSNLSSGVYIVKVVDERGFSESKKIVVP